VAHYTTSAPGRQALHVPTGLGTDHRAMTPRCWAFDRALLCVLLFLDFTSCHFGHHCHRSVCEVYHPRPGPLTVIVVLVVLMAAATMATMVELVPAQALPVLLLMAAVAVTMAIVVVVVKGGGGGAGHGAAAYWPWMGWSSEQDRRPCKRDAFLCT
jgi:hypothetical protein